MSEKSKNTDWYGQFCRLREVGVPVTKICKGLGIPRSTVYKRLKKMKGGPA